MNTRAEPLPPGDDRSRLSRISTLWTLVNQAHAGAESAVPEAQQRLLQRYCGAAYRYLLGASRDEAVAEELFQEFALKFLRGDFRRADAGRGRFRDYLKMSLIHMISDYRSTLRNRPGSLPEQIAAPDVQVSPEDDAVFLASWRDELLQRTWQALAAAHPAQYEVLLRRVENPDQTMAEIASTLTVPGGSKEQTAASVRVVLHRARARFAQLLMAEVQASMPEASPQAITDELRSLGLLPYVQAAPGA